MDGNLFFLGEFFCYSDASVYSLACYNDTKDGEKNGGQFTEGERTHKVKDICLLPVMVSFIYFDFFSGQICLVSQ